MEDYEVSIHWDEEKIRMYNIPKLRNQFPSVTTVLSIDHSDKVWLEIWEQSFKEEDEKAKVSFAPIIKNYKAICGTIVHYLAANYAAKMWGLLHIPLDIERNSDQMNYIQTYYSDFKVKSPKTGNMIGVPGNYGKSLYLDTQEGYRAYQQWFKDFKPQPPIHEVGSRKGQLLLINPCEHVVYHQIFRYAGTADLLCSIDGKNVLVDLKYTDNEPLKYPLQITGYRMALRNLYPTTKFERMGILHLKLRPENIKLGADGKPRAYRFEETAPSKELETDWLYRVGAYYHANKNHPQLSTNAEYVLQSLRDRQVEIITDMSSGWKERLSGVFS